MSIDAVTDAVRRRSVSAVEVVRDCLARIERDNPPLNAFRETYPEEALEAAKEIDRRLAAGDDPGQLAGVPIAVKDNIVTEVGFTCCGSRLLENYRSPFTATAVRRLINAGAILIGKTNCDEFAMGSSTEHCAFGPVRNPWDHTRVPGGSSGGSAAAVAAGMVPAALGSETGGSIRQPASFCGVVGVKPSYGRVSRFGLVAFGSSLDQIGPLARSVRDAATLLNVMAGVDRRDATSAAAPVPDYARELEQPVQPLRLGVPRQYFSAANDAAVNEIVRGAIATFAELGASIVDLDLPLTDYGIAVYYILAPAEASSNLARFDGIRYGRRAALEVDEGLFDLYAKSRAEGFGPEVQRRIMLGTYVLSAGYYEAYYKRALQARRLIRAEFDRAFQSCDAIIGPVAPTTAFPIGSHPEPLSMYLADVYTVNASIAGVCAISVPAGVADAGGAGAEGLPIGVQLQCRAFDEATLFRVARVLETHTPALPNVSI